MLPSLRPMISVALVFVSTTSFAQSEPTPNAEKPKTPVEIWEATVRPQGSKPNAIATDSAERLAEVIIADHMANKGAKAPLIVINNVGPSDSEFQNKDAVAANAQSEMERYAQANKGQNATGIEVAGNTNTGVGRLVTAVQSPEFVARMQKEYGFSVQTAGVSGSAAAINHAGYSSPGNPFMNINLDYTALIGQGESWDAKVDPKAVSEVVRFSISMLVLSTVAGVNIQAPFVVREGGEIGMREAIEFLTELKRLKETGKYVTSDGKTVSVPWNQLKDHVKVIMEPGHVSGTKVNEVAKDKGPRGATDLALVLASLANSPEYRALIGDLNIEVRQIDKSGNVVSSSNDRHALERFAQSFLSSEEGRELMKQAEELRALRAAGNTAALMRAWLQFPTRKLTPSAKKSTLVEIKPKLKPNWSSCMRFKLANVWQHSPMLRRHSCLFC